MHVLYAHAHINYYLSLNAYDRESGALQELKTMFRAVFVGPASSAVAWSL